MSVARNVLRQARDMVARYPQIHRAIRAVWTPPKSIHQHLGFNGTMTVEIEPGASFELQCHGEYVENELFWRGFGTGWEGKSLRLWTELARSADWVVDIGANTGVYALATKAVRPQAKVMAVEPSKRVFEKLLTNIALNDASIIAVDQAASDAAGVVTFFDVATEHQYIGSLEPSSALSVASEVRAEKMDVLLAAHGFDGLDLVKIDVERHEPAVLRGMRTALERWKPTMIVEILDDEVERGIRSALDGLDYDLRPVGRERSPDPVADARNFLAAPAEAFDELAPLLARI